MYYKLLKFCRNTARNRTVGYLGAPVHANTEGATADHALNEFCRSIPPIKYIRKQSPPPKLAK